MAPNPRPEDKKDVTRVDSDPEGYEFINGYPNIGGTKCSFTISTFNESLGGDVVWENCCNEKDISSCSIQFPKQQKCMTGYFSCGDVLNHPAMCTSDTSGYNEKTKKSLDRKCCPKDYTCGSSFDAPCQRISGPFDAPELSLEPKFTLPQYASSPGVFNGCDINEISAGTVGGITAAGILVFCIIVSVVLYFVRQRIYRDPRRLARRRMISKMIDEHLRSPGSSVSDTQFKKGQLFDEPPESPAPAVLRRNDSRGQHMKTQQPHAMTFDGITVTREVKVQTIEEGNENAVVSNNQSEDSISSIQPPRRLNPAGETWFEMEQEKQAKRSQLFTNQRF